MFRLEFRNIVETVKQSLRQQFAKVSETWLVNGMFEYYLVRNSERALEILGSLKKLHHIYLL